MTKQPSIVVTGTGAVSGIPDQCVMAFGLNGMGTSAAEALETCAEAADLAISALVGSGVDRSDVRTTNLSLRDYFDPEVQKVTARLASYQVQATVRALEDLGRVIGAVSDAAGDALQIHSVQLVVGDASPLQKEARRLAVRDARTKAGELVEAAGLQLGKVLSINDSSAGAAPPARAYPVARASSGHVAGSVPVESGEVATSASVTIAFAIGT